MSDRPFRFGVVAGQAPDLETWTGLARRVEQLGFDTLLSPDPQSGLDPLTTLSAAAAVTTTLHVGTFVAVDVFRDPRSLVWQAQTLHSLTGGRFELGLGTGRPQAAEHARSLGRDFGSAGTRVERLAETVAYLKQQAERPPLLLAAGGPRMRALAAREAEIVTLAWMPRTTEAEAKSIVEAFRRDAGARLGEIELAINLLAVGDGPAPWLERFAGVSSAELVAGGPREGVETLRRWREELGVSYISTNSGGLEAFAPIVAELHGT
jgi:alkanesulfonate monooxygenase SsuD/methylene tetrahydromethanopterin reductase-like flavin-dependent oxidoreductase (luciferase family)